MMYTRLKYDAHGLVHALKLLESLGVGKWSEDQLLRIMYVTYPRYRHRMWKTKDGDKA